MEAEPKIVNRQNLRTMKPMDLSAFTGEQLAETGKPDQSDDTPEGLRLRRLMDITNDARITLDDEYPDQERALSIHHNGNVFTLGSIGDFSLVTGKAKSRKTFLMAMVLAACVGYLRMVGELIACDLPEEKRRVIWIDTEQSKRYVWKRLRVVAELAGVTDLKNIEVYSLREFSPGQRKEVVDFLLVHDNPKKEIGLVIIDGIRDLVVDINSPQEATDIASFLLKHSKDAHCHIITVLHQNKGDTNARGHVGSELVNKAEVVLSVSVSKEDTNTSVVEATDCRDKDFPSFSFSIDEHGIPVIMQDQFTGTNGNESTKKKKINPYEIPPDTHKGLLQNIFKNKGPFTRPQMLSEIRVAWKSLDQIVSYNDSVDMLTYYGKMNWLKNNGKVGMKAEWILIT